MKLIALSTVSAIHLVIITAKRTSGLLAVFVRCVLFSRSRKVGDLSYVQCFDTVSWMRGKTSCEEPVPLVHKDYVIFRKVEKQSQ